MDEPDTSVATITRRVDAPTQAVWDVLADGWFYATWVVGASRVRGVDEGWPAAGTRIHHSFGVWPAVVSDTTHVISSTAPTELVLRAKGWPAGEAKVVITVTPAGGESCTVAMTEDAVTGPGTLVPRPLRQLAIGPRNVEALRRLAYLAEGRHRERASAR